MKKVIVSHSMLATATLCETKAVAQTMNWTTGTASSDAPMMAGQCAHLAWEQWLLGQPPEVVIRTFRDAYKPFSDAYVLSDDRLHLSNLERVFEAFCAQCMLSEQPFEVVVRAGEIQSENQMFASLGHNEQYDDVVISDKSDGIVRNKDTGDLYSLEWKSTGSWLGDDTMAKYLLDDQVTTHTHVCRENGYDVKGVLMFIVQFSKLPVPAFKTNKKGETTPAKCRTHSIATQDCWPSHLRFQRFFVDRSEEQINQWKREAEREAYKYADAVESFRAAGNTFTGSGIGMQGLFNGTCSNCFMKTVCLQDRRETGRLSTRTVNDPSIVRSGVYVS
jgi:hypothetical protein